MSTYRHILLFICVLCISSTHASNNWQAAEELKNRLTQTTDPRQRIQLLLDLKDLNEDTDLNLSYSIRLFHEAAAVNDTHAMAIAALPIVFRFQPYPEKRDTLLHYIAILRRATRHTPEEGIDAYLETSIELGRLNTAETKEQVIRVAHELKTWCNSTAHPGNIYHQAKLILLRASIEVNLDYFERGVKQPLTRQVEAWSKAYALTHQMRGMIVRQQFASTAFRMLGACYAQQERHSDLVELTNDYCALLDDYVELERQHGNRPYLYIGNSYMRPYQELLYCARRMGRPDLEKRHFEEFCQRIRESDPRNSLRNKAYIYKFGYNWKTGNNELKPALCYCDSLVTLLEGHPQSFESFHSQSMEIYRDRGRMLLQCGRPEEALTAYRQTLRVIDTTFKVQHRERSKVLRAKLEANQRRLDDALNRKYAHAIAIFALVFIGLLLIGASVYLYKSLRYNRQLQRRISDHNKKAQECEQMKSSFVNTVCRGISAPLNAIDQTACHLASENPTDEDKQNAMRIIRQNTTLLLSVLNDMLEAANLNSLNELLQFSEVDINELCSAQMHEAIYSKHQPSVDCRIEAPAGTCSIRSNPQYLSFVLHKLLENARRHTQQGSITLRYAIDESARELHLSITDTGVGIPPCYRSLVFEPHGDHRIDTSGLNLSLCAQVVRQLHGTIWLDESYTSGTRICLTLPVKP